MCDMNPESFLSNFWGSLHYDTPSYFLYGILDFVNMLPVF